MPTKQDLANAVAKLGQVGVRRIVITADHGFLAPASQFCR